MASTGGRLLPSLLIAVLSKTCGTRWRNIWDVKLSQEQSSNSSMAFKPFGWQWTLRNARNISDTSERSSLVSSSYKEQPLVTRSCILWTHLSALLCILPSIPVPMSYLTMIVCKIGQKWNVNDNYMYNYTYHTCTCNAVLQSYSLARAISELCTFSLLGGDNKDGGNSWTYRHGRWRTC